MASDALDVSTGVCLPRTGRPSVVADDAAWDFDVESDGDVVLTPFRID